jgi:ketosteroid isomerase-like protein
MSSKINAYLDIIEQWKNGSVEGIVGHFTEDIVWHTAAGIDPPSIGKEAIRSWLTQYAAQSSDQLKNSRWRVLSYSESETQLFVEGVEDNEMANGIRVAIPYAGVYDFRDNLICGGRDYFDRGLSVRLKEGEAVPDFVEQLNARPMFRGRS